MYVSLHSNCLHHIICAKFDLKIFYSPPWEEGVVFHACELWSYQKGNWQFGWESALNNLDANDQVSVFNLTIMNIVTNIVIPNEIVTCDDQDP